MDIRGADLAGSWYPGDSKGCERAIATFEAELREVQADPPPARGGVVPHAGWAYSGRVAYNVFREISRSGARPDTVILLGKHMHPTQRPTILVADRFDSPLGAVAMDTELTMALQRALDLEAEDGRHHEADNTIELQVPFVRHLFPQARLVAMGVPPHRDAISLGRELVGQIRALGRQATVVGSTDLTHYGLGYGFSPRGKGEEALRWVKEENDASLIERLRTLDPQGVLDEAARKHNACCPGAAAAAVEACRLMGARSGVVVDYTTSQDVVPEPVPVRFVGYVGLLL